jgi:predicted outer membrane lipoprotein
VLKRDLLGAVVFTAVYIVLEAVLYRQPVQDWILGAALALAFGLIMVAWREYRRRHPRKKRGYPYD